MFPSTYLYAHFCLSHRKTLDGKTKMSNKSSQKKNCNR